MGNKKDLNNTELKIYHLGKANPDLKNIYLIKYSIDGK
tara:strand:- start:224 stop:337 length:114 start_codon:yes stop_codon:yes gene_type:complete